MILDQVKSWFRHSRTILAARAVQIAGAIVAIEPVLAGEDWTPVLTRIYGTVPPDLRPLAIGASIAAVGALFEYLRRITTGPIKEA